MSSILLVEDSPTQAMQMKLLLESANHQVACCGDGTDALQHLAQEATELVITDMELPVMNGLDLIKRMQVEFPHIPAVLVTGFGSERLAAEALRIGATAYVPKAMLDELLLGTIEDVLGITRTDRSYADLIECMTENRLVFELPSNPRLLTTAIDLTLQLASGMQLFSGVDAYRVGTALRHAASNAIFRGNLELTRDQFQHSSTDGDITDIDNPLVAERMESAPYKNRKVHYEARLLPDLIRVVIRDEGRGFKPTELPSEEEIAAVSGEGGRGLLLMHKFMDKVTFNPAGNEVTLIKHCSPRS
ncbi:MAG: response regulator [Planctomycetota bacterium]|nr:MAG: response regulator [Planctomycetota bacterium]